MVVNCKPVILFTFSIRKSKIPFVDGHIRWVQLTKASGRPRVDYMAVHRRFYVAAGLVIVASNAILFAPHV
jgi:hypothetical protein